MTSSYYHSRGQPQQTTTTRFFSNDQSKRPSLSDTAYNGSEGHIDDRVNSFELEQEDYQAEGSRVASPRPTFGGRLLSSLSNAQPAAAALGRKGSILHSRAKSLAGFVPKLNSNANSNQSTPERSQGPNRLFQSFFDGESAPIRIGPPISPTKEKEESEFVMEYRSSFTERPRTMPRRQSNAPSTMSTPASTKTSWFGRKSTATTPVRQQVLHDELATLNINTSLFPNGAVDPLNPASFNDLLINATNLLNRMQAAYREKADYISSIQPEIEAQREEVEETETRNAHLKMQLEDLGRKAQEQEQAMQEMARQVQDAKMEAEEAREAAKTIRVVRESDDVEDTPTRRCGKRSSASSASASDSGFESDLDSVFSAGGVPSPDYDGGMWELRPPKNEPSSQSRRDLTARPGMAGKRLGSEGAAWATVEALRGENNELKGRVEEMQRTIDGCIDFVGMLKG